MRVDLVSNNQDAVGISIPISLDVGGDIDGLLWDTNTGEYLRTNVISSHTCHINDNANFILPQTSFHFSYAFEKKYHFQVDVPTNGAWNYSDAFTQSQPQMNFTNAKFLREFRVYRTNFIDIVRLTVKI